jgi:hypothetical protein
MICGLLGRDRRSYDGKRECKHVKTHGAAPKNWRIFIALQELSRR